MSELAQRAAFATGVLPDIYAFHRYTWNSTRLYQSLARQYPGISGVELRDFTADLTGHLPALYAQ